MFLGPIREDFSQNTQYSRDRTGSDHIQWIGTAPVWGMGPPTHLKNFNLELFLSKGNVGTKSRAETEGKTNQRLPRLGIYPICRHQTQTLLLMSRSACWQEPGIAVPWEADQYRYRYSQPTIGLSLRAPIEELVEGPKEPKGIATP
jgi:hypothetical protein